jgi:hypothetical protein
MGPHVRRALLCVLATAVLFVLESPALASVQPGSPCSDPKVSAASQYCENIPSAAGGSVVGVGTPALGARLSPGVVNRLRGTYGAAGAGTARGGAHAAATSGNGPPAGATRSQQATRRVRAGLLALPAPGPRVFFPGHSIARSSGWALVPGLAAVLAASGLALAAAALIRRRATRPI